MKFNPILPELYVTDFKKSLHFYTETIGFKVEYSRENPLFAFLSYEGTQIMIQQLDPKEDHEYITGKFEYPFGRGINFQIDVKNIEQINNSFKKHNYPLRKELEDSWYKVKNELHGCRQILVQDPDGYLLRFSQDIGQKPAK